MEAEIGTKEKELDLAQAIAEAVRNGMVGLSDNIKTLDASFSEARKIWEVKPKSEEDKKDTSAKLAQTKGVVGQIMDFEIMGVPVGQAVVGGFGAVFATEVIDGVLVTQTVQVKGVVKLVAAGATAMWAKPLFGSTGSKVIALLITFDALRDLSPIDMWAKQLAAMISGILPKAGLADVSQRRVLHEADVILSSAQRMARR